MVAHALSVRQTEKLVYDILHPAPKPEKKERVVDPNVKDAERELERSLGVRARIYDRKGKGKVVLEYKSLEDFDRILEAVGKAVVSSREKKLRHECSSAPDRSADYSRAGDRVALSLDSSISWARLAPLPLDTSPQRHVKPGLTLRG